MDRLSRRCLLSSNMATDMVFNGGSNLDDRQKIIYTAIGLTDLCHVRYSKYDLRAGSRRTITCNPAPIPLALPACCPDRGPVQSAAGQNHSGIRYLHNKIFPLAENTTCNEPPPAYLMALCMASLTMSNSSFRSCMRILADSPFGHFDTGSHVCTFQVSHESLKPVYETFQIIISRIDHPDDIAHSLNGLQRHLQKYAATDQLGSGGRLLYLRAF